MANPSKRKGSSFERLIVDYLAEHVSDFIDRRVQAGAKDKGDVANVRFVGRRVVLEAKNHARMELSQWVIEAHEEAVNDDALLGVVVHKRRGFGRAGEQYVTMTLEDFVNVLRVSGGRPPLK